MMELLVAILINALEIVGFREALKTYYLSGISGWLQRNLPGWLWSPIGGCYKCMASIHGTLFYILVMERMDLFEMLFYIPAVCGMAVMLYRK